MTPQLTILADTKRNDTCRSCGAPIVWARLASGGQKWMPLDAPLVVEATLANERTLEIISSKSHFATCPDAKTWRQDR